MVYQRNDEFEVADVAVFAGDDKQQWRPIATVANKRLGEGSFEETAIPLSAAIGRKTRYLKLAVRKTPEAKRVLLGEIVLEGLKTEAARPAYRMPPTPMQVKRVLDDALLNAGVQFLYGCYATELLRDGERQTRGHRHDQSLGPAGREGQGDHRCHAAGRRRENGRCALRSLSGGHAHVQANRHRRRAQRTSRTCRPGSCRLPSTTAAGRIHQAIEYTLEIPMNDDSFASYAQAEQMARDMTWHAEQVDASEMLFEIPPDRIRGEALQCCSWPGADKVDLDVFRPDRHGASLRPLRLCGRVASGGRAVAAAAGTDAGRRTNRHGRRGRGQDDCLAARRRRVAKRAGKPIASGDVREDPAWMRVGSETARVQAGDSVLPVLGRV